MNKQLGSTYRLQLNGFGLRRATDLVDYLHDLGITTLYVSPLTAAQSGSTHGYDVVDPLRLDPSLGDPQDLSALLKRLDEHGMQMLIDIVPNHMSTSPENRWWSDVLRRGPRSDFARFFDIDWVAGDGKLVLPVLSRPFGEALEAGEVRLEVNDVEQGQSEGDTLSIRCGDLLLPISPETLQALGDDPQKTAADLNGTEGDPASFDRLQALLDAQHYRLAHWQVARYEVNYRRFFDIDGLVGVRVEDPEVFESTHRFLLELAADKRVVGLRVDHVDGLADPGAYLDRLRAALLAQEPTGRESALVIEKILARGEELPGTWHVDGTTGYEFADLAIGLLMDPSGAAQIGDDREAFHQLSVEARRQVVDNAFAGQLDRLSAQFATAAHSDRHGRDLVVADIREALRELSAHIPVYRTYLTNGETDSTDRRIVDAATQGAKDGSPARALQVVHRILLGDALGPNDAGGRNAETAHLATRWQQFTSAVVAKGVEDTALYRFSGLLSSADVGSDPGSPAVEVKEFHAAMVKRSSSQPGGLNTVSTHDSKRSGDVRSRLAVLSEIPGRWNALVDWWHELHTGLALRAFGHETLPRQVELSIYQTIVGAWPLQAEDRSGFSATVQQAMLKAVREAKVNTSWTDPNAGFEQGLEVFVDAVLDPTNTAFHQDLESLISEIGIAGAVNSLALVLLEVTAPGVPDIYQGTEVWQPLLVDPDNRRPVDFAMLRRTVSELPNTGDSVAAGELMANWRDCALKLFVTRASLTTRRDEPDLFAGGS